MSTAIGTFYLQKNEHIGFLEWSLISVGVICFVLGIVIYWRMRNRINKLYE